MYYRGEIFPVLTCPTLLSISPTGYSDFGLIFDHIKRLDADVISVEASKSDLKLLEVFHKHGYENLIGPGL